MIIVRRFLRIRQHLPRGNMQSRWKHPYLELIPKKKPDLVLLDYEMPGMDGKMIFEAMLEDEYMSQIPVIFLTSISQKDRVYGVLKSVPAGYILNSGCNNSGND